MAYHVADAYARMYGGISRKGSVMSAETPSNESWGMSPGGSPLPFADAVCAVLSSAGFVVLRDSSTFYELLSSFADTRSVEMRVMYGHCSDRLLSPFAQIRPGDVGLFRSAVDAAYRYFVDEWLITSAAARSTAFGLGEGVAKWLGDDGRDMLAWLRSPEAAAEPAGGHGVFSRPAPDPVRPAPGFDRPAPDPFAPVAQTHKYCPSCGHKVQADDLFCLFCGMSLRADTAPRSGIPVNYSWRPNPYETTACDDAWDDAPQINEGAEPEPVMSDYQPPLPPSPSDTAGFAPQPAPSPSDTGAFPPLTPPSPSDTGAFPPQVPSSPAPRTGGYQSPSPSDTAGFPSLTPPSPSPRASGYQRPSPAPRASGYQSPSFSDTAGFPSHPSPTAQGGGRFSRLKDAARSVFSRKKPQESGPDQPAIQPPQPPVLTPPQPPIYPPQQPPVYPQWPAAYQPQQAPTMTDVRFTAVAPRELVRGSYVQTDVLMFEDGWEGVVDEIREEYGVPTSTHDGGWMQVAKETTVRVELSSPELGVLGTQKRVWGGRYIRFDFLFLLPGDFPGAQIAFVANVWFNDIPATRLSFVASCSAGGRQVMEPRRDDVLRAFVSYASQDRARVASIVQGMRAARPDLRIFFDVESLRCGENWQQALRSEIEDSDVLYLCWSLSARASTWVDFEWRYALDNKGIDCIEPVAIDPPDACPPPLELESKHFNDPLLYVIKAS